MARVDEDRGVGRGRARAGVERFRREFVAPRERRLDRFAPPRRPAHGSNFHESDVGDDHASDADVGDPLSSIRRLRQKRVQLHFFKCGPATDKMMTLMKAASVRRRPKSATRPRPRDVTARRYRTAGRGESSKLQLREHDLGSDPGHNFLTYTVNSITESVSVTLDSSHQGGHKILAAFSTKHAFRRSKMQAIGEDEDEEALDAPGACGRFLAPGPDDRRVFPGADQDVEVYTAEDDGGCGGKKPSGRARVALSREPFAAGALRASFWCALRAENRGVLLRDVSRRRLETRLREISMS